MTRIVAFIGCCLVAWASYQLLPTKVYITTADSQIDVYSGETTLYFWVENQHREQFQIGKVYQLESNQQQKQLMLSTVSFAEIKPDSVKLGFRLAKSDHFSADATEYVISEITLDNRIQ